MFEMIHSISTQYSIWALLIAFILGAFTDVVWVHWNVSSNRLRPCGAANWSALIGVFSVIYTLIIVEKNFWQIAAYIAGAWVGTYVTVALIKLRRKKG